MTDPKSIADKVTEYDCPEAEHVSESPGGRSPNITYPQQHRLGLDGLEIEVKMVPAATLKVRVSDSNGDPVEDALAHVWPNVQWDRWSSTVLGSDLWKTKDLIQLPKEATSDFWRGEAAKHDRFQVKTDRDGWAELRTVPSQTVQFSVRHEQHVLPIRNSGVSSRRDLPVTLSPGETTEASATLEPKGADPLRHY